MALPVQPPFWKRIFASLGQYAQVPDDKPQAGRASLKEGFPEETQRPLRQGGVAPNRLDFNGLFMQLTGHAFFKQSGGIFRYSEERGYSPPAWIFHDGLVWMCLAPNGPESDRGGVEPGTDGEVWQDLLTWLAVKAGGSGGAGGDVTTVFGGNPVGTLIHYWGTAAPAGYFACDGGAFSATDYPKLYAVLGDKAVLPDLRGCFLRSLGGGAGALGAVQQDAGRNATGGFLTDNTANGRGEAIGLGYDPRGVFTPGPMVANFDISSGMSYPANWHPGDGGGFLNLDLSREWGASHTANEFRPVNAAVLVCIRHD